MSEVFDLDAALAADERSVAREPFRFKIKDELFEIPNPPPFEATLVGNSETVDQVGKLLKALLGRDSFDRLLGVIDHNRSWEQLNLLVEKYKEFMGVEVGKSQPSTKPLKSTRKR